MEEQRKETGMDKMKQMMGNMGDMGDMPSMMEKCMKVFQSMSGTGTDKGVTTTFATPEIQGLFEEWVMNVEEEILGLLKDKGSILPLDIAAKLKISEESILFLIGKMAREKKLKITGVSL